MVFHNLQSHLAYRYIKMCILIRYTFCECLVKICVTKHKCRFFGTYYERSKIIRTNFQTTQFKRPKSQKAELFYQPTNSLNQKYGQKWVRLDLCSHHSRSQTIIGLFKSKKWYLCSLFGLLSFFLWKFDFLIFVLFFFRLYGFGVLCDFGLP